MNMQISLKRICNNYDNPKDACPLTEEKTTSFMIIKQGRKSSNKWQVIKARPCVYQFQIYFNANFLRYQSNGKKEKLYKC